MRHIGKYCWAHFERKTILTDFKFGDMILSDHKLSIKLLYTMTHICVIGSRDLWNIVISMLAVGMEQEKIAMARNVLKCSNGIRYTIHTPIGMRIDEQKLNVEVKQNRLTVQVHWLNSSLIVLIPDICIVVSFSA